jgi:hypothetical protein
LVAIINVIIDNPNSFVRRQNDDIYVVKLNVHGDYKFYENLEFFWNFWNLKNFWNFWKFCENFEIFGNFVKILKFWT